MQAADVTSSTGTRFESDARRLWWREQGIGRYVAGVFEGGGAKGVVYQGALEAMVGNAEGPYWFSAVAGSSAGAITATLIAAGLEPAQVSVEAENALGTLRKPTRLNGAFRLRNGASYLDQDSLVDWLGGVLECQVSKLCGKGGGESVTFEELYRLTCIELDVVAVDLKRQRLVIFNYELTPECSVGEAVVASTAIPVAFEWRPLRLRQQYEGFGIIVDGGVMANFPTFVFKDASFREWAGLRPYTLSVPVVGFLLDEQDRDHVTQPDLYGKAKFWPPLSQWDKYVRAISSSEKDLPDDFEPERPKFRPRGARSTWSQVLASLSWAMLWPLWKLLFDWMPTLLRLNAKSARGNWPQPQNQVARSLINWFDAVVAGTRPWFVFLGGFLAASLCIGVGAYYVAWRPLVGHVGDWIDGDVSIFWGILGSLILLVGSLVPIYAWMVLSIVFSASWLLHRTVQITGYGLVKTFLQGPAAPLWAGTAPDDHVVRLRVPPGITTLEISVGKQKVAAAVEEARKATLAELARLKFPGSENVGSEPVT